jgi:hypothetical protein
MKADREGLETSDQRLSQECNRHDQDGEKKKGEEDGCKSASPAEQLLQLAVCGVTSNSDGESPSDNGDEGAQNKEAGDGKQDDKAKVNEDFEGPVQVRLVGPRLARSHVVPPSQDQARSLFDQLITQARKIIF